MENTENEITDELKQIAAKHNVPRAYKLTVVVDDATDETASAYFRKPDIDTFSAALSMQTRDPFKAKIVILKSTFLEGDHRVIDTTDGLMNAALHVDDIINLQRGELKKN